MVPNDSPYVGMKYWIFVRPLEAPIQYSRTITRTRELILRNNYYVLFVLMHHFTWSTTVRKHSYSQLKYLIKINWSTSVFLHENSVLYVHYLIHGYTKWFHHNFHKRKDEGKTSIIRCLNSFAVNFQRYQTFTKFTKANQNFTNVRKLKFLEAPGR